ncbi:MAG: hypothetical protein R3D61_11430 [Defluviimonas denitrificans]
MVKVLESLANRLNGDIGGVFRTLLNTVNSSTTKSRDRDEETGEPLAIVRGRRSERSIDQISPGSVTSKRVRRGDDELIRRVNEKKAARSAGRSIGAGDMPQHPAIPTRPDRATPRVRRFADARPSRRRDREAQGQVDDGVAGVFQRPWAA